MSNLSDFVIDGILEVLGIIVLEGRKESGKNSAKLRSVCNLHTVKIHKNREFFPEYSKKAVFFCTLFSYKSAQSEEFRHFLYKLEKNLNG